MLKLKSHMVLSNDTITSLAEYLGLSRQTLSSRMNGHSPFKTDEIVLIADKYNLSSDEIIAIFF
jgi:transcriptional regulator with XRE-family HTH domain